jgi:hypothetical protein
MAMLKVANDGCPVKMKSGHHELTIAMKATT